MGKPEYEVEHGKTSGLLLWLTKYIHHLARYVVLDSGFCVLKGLISLVKSGVFACALIKNAGTGLPTAKVMSLTSTLLGRMLVTQLL